MSQSLQTHILGFPRIGGKRELKKATEAYWKREITENDLNAIAADLRKEAWLEQKAAGIDLIPSNDFSFYDQMLDMTCLLGVVPPRFEWDGGKVSLDLRFKIARGVSAGGNGKQEDCQCGNHSAVFASEMTKWFDTNYHYIVPEFHQSTTFKVSSDKVFAEFNEAKNLGITSKPVLIGPITYLYLGKSMEDSFDRLSLLESLLPVYAEIIQQLAAQGATAIQIDEPVLAFDLDADWQTAFVKAGKAIRAAAPEVRLILATYFGELRENLPLALSLPVDVLHYDAVRGRNEIEILLNQFPDHLSLSLGIVDGRNIWKNDFDASLSLIKQAQDAVGNDRLWLAPSCSLLHSPVSLKFENKLDEELKSWLAFAVEKLAEVKALAALATGVDDSSSLEQNRLATQSRKVSTRIHVQAVQDRLSAISDADSHRHSGFQTRRQKQRASLALPLFPTTTIGSFPQTEKVRQMRAKWKKGHIPNESYETFLRMVTSECVHFQEDIGIDVLVHGEFERNDMVEYFGEQLDGFAFTSNGWVQSYGSRCVKPPVIYGDVSRPEPMTVKWSTFAQSLTHKPMKGMLTGPVTILQWSFVRDDQPRSETTKQIALAIRDEVVDLEAAGIRVIQIDEPALREGLPLRRNDWNAYLDWAVQAFRLSAAGVCDETQIHTHMCYCEFNDIMPAIAALDADVISIETSRSNMELLSAFAEFQYPNEVGPGVWDIHSPRVPAREEMVSLLRKAAAVVPVDQLWVNPDCGLKTRGWDEVRLSLQNMVSTARLLREEVVAVTTH